jgi:hypothetical protein
MRIERRTLPRSSKPSEKPSGSQYPVGAILSAPITIQIDDDLTNAFIAGYDRTRIELPSEEATFTVPSSSDKTSDKTSRNRATSEVGIAFPEDEYYYKGLTGKL